jgi:hypothetical protein
MEETARFSFPVIINQWWVAHIRTIVLKATALTFRLSLSDELNTPPTPVGSRAIPHCDGSLPA